MAKIDQLLQIVTDASVSDLHLVPGSVPVVRVNGRIEKTSHKKLSSENIQTLLYEILSDEQIRRFEKENDLDFSYGVPDTARFRINMYRMLGGAAAAIRPIPEQVFDLADLGFAEAVEELLGCRAGLVLVTGPTNAGKSTTLRAMIDFINTSFQRHIVTLEDPIEYIHPPKNSLISQREVGRHVESFAAGVKSALREDPDVIVVGELRDTETIRGALTAAERGLLVLGTLHTVSARATLERIVDVFPGDQQPQARVILADSLQGIVSQQLLTRANGGGRVLAYELMRRTDEIAAMIRENRDREVVAVIQASRAMGMRLMDNHLKALVDAGIVAPEEAIRVATDPQQFMEREEQAEAEVAGSNE